MDKQMTEKLDEVLDKLDNVLDKLDKTAEYFCYIQGVLCGYLSRKGER